MSAHRDPDTVADYAKNAKFARAAGDHRRRRAGRGAAGRGGGAHRSAGDRRAAHLQDLGRRRPRRAARRSRRCRRACRWPAWAWTTPATPPCWRRGSSSLSRVIERYTRPEMGACGPSSASSRPGSRWSWRWCDALAEQRRDPGRGRRARSASAPRSPPRRSSEREQVTDHDVAAFVDVVAAVGRRGRALGAPRAHLLGRARHRARRCSSRQAGLVLVSRARATTATRWSAAPASTWTRSASAARTACTPSPPPSG